MLAEGDRADVAAAGRAGVRVRGPLVRSKEEDPSIAGPGRREGLDVRAHVADDRGPDGPIPALGQIAPGAAGPRKRPGVDVARARADGDVGAVGGQRGPVGGPRGIAVAALPVGDAARRAVDGRHVDVRDRVHLPRLRAIRDERDLAAIRGELRLRVVPIAGRDLSRLVAIRTCDPHVFSPCVQEAGLVRPVVEAVVDTDAVVLGALRPLIAHDEGEESSVRRPHEIAAVLAE